MRQRWGNLPAELSSFIDRGRERAELKRLLAVSRLVTVTGVGGVGKTRVALRVAAELQRGFDDGVWLVDLSVLTDPGLVVEVVAQALGVRDQTMRPQTRILADYLASRRLLLVLDTCEHLARSCAELVDTLLRAAPGLHVLATSRQPLGVDGEHVFALSPFLSSDPDQPVAEVPVDDGLDAAVLLFAERASAAAPGFVLTESNHGAVARLCRRLDGIPLGIELAAIRTRAMTVHEIAELFERRSTHRLRLLSRRGGGGGGRHDSLRKAMDWSHAMCTPAERLLWARVSVFAGDFDLATARKVCGDEQLAGSDVAQLLGRLVDKSILLCEQHPSGARYRLLDTVRDYGLDLLAATGEQAALRSRHRDFYLRLARRFDNEWCGPDQVAWYTRLGRQHANLRAALDFSLSEAGEYGAGLDLAGALVNFWIACGHLREGRHFLDWALALDLPPSPALTKALWACAWIALVQGDTVAAQARLTQCRPYAQADGDAVAMGWICHVAAAIAMVQGQLAQAVSLADEAAALHRRDGDPGAGLLNAVSAKAMYLALAGESDRAIAVTDECRALCDRYGEQWVRSFANHFRALVELGRGDPAAAVGYAREALSFKRQLADSGGSAMALDLLACAAAAQGQAERAARLLGFAHQVWHTFGLPQFGSPELTTARADVQRQAREQLGDHRYNIAYADGLRLGFDAGLAYALDEQPPPLPTPRKPTDWAPLTRREREVAELVTAGLTNQQIAERLFVARRTANTHVEHILTKLDFTSRSQIAAWVANHHSDHTD